MKIKFKTYYKVGASEGFEMHEYDVDSITIIGKDDDTYRIRQDIERGIEVTADGLSSKLHIEPRVTNQVTLITIEDV